MDVNRFFFVAGAVVAGVFCSALSFSQLTPPIGQRRPVAPKTRGSVFVPGVSASWINSSMSPETLAAKTDQALSWTKGEGVASLVEFQDKNVRGTTKCVTEIEGPTRFRLEYPVSAPDPSPKPNKGTLFSKMIQVADGSRMAYQSAEFGLKTPQPLSSASLMDGCALDQWPKHFPQLMYSPIRGGKPFTKLVASARALGNSVKITVLERKFDFKGMILHQARMTIVRKNSGAPLGIDLIIDLSQFRPLSIAAQGGPSKSDMVTSSWTGTWGRPKSGKFSPSDFIIPKATKPPPKKRQA